MPVPDFPPEVHRRLGHLWGEADAAFKTYTEAYANLEDTPELLGNPDLQIHMLSLAARTLFDGKPDAFLKAAREYIVNAWQAGYNTCWELGGIKDTPEGLAATAAYRIAEAADHARLKVLAEISRLHGRKVAFGELIRSVINKEFNLKEIETERYFNDYAEVTNAVSEIEVARERLLEIYVKAPD